MHPWHEKLDTFCVTLLRVYVVAARAENEAKNNFATLTSFWVGLVCFAAVVVVVVARPQITPRPIIYCNAHIHFTYSEYIFGYIHTHTTHSRRQMFLRVYCELYHLTTLR